MSKIEDDPLFSHREVRNITHVRATFGDRPNPDTHVVRDTIHYTDGRRVNQVTVLEDYKRPFYITKQKYRTYKQHKEFEPLDKVSTHYSTDSDLASAIGRALGKHYVQGSVREQCNSPYVFGAQSAAKTLIRRAYKKKWPNKPLTPQRYLAYDLETCVFDEDGSIIIASVAIEDEVEVYIRADFLADIPNPIQAIEALQSILFERHGYTEIMKNCTIAYSIEEDEAAVIKKLAERMHFFDPDVVAAWNHDFDVNKILNRCKALNLSAADLFSHPSVPVWSRRFRFIEGKRNKVTANGTFRPLAPSEQWHNVQATSGFVWLDAMCVYRALRSQNQFLSSYGLDNISSIHLGVGKLETKETEHMDGLSRHRHMQRKDKLTYCVYAAMDVRLMVCIERITKDITLRLPVELSGSDYFDVTSSSQLTIDMFAEDMEADGRVFGTVGSNPDEFPEEVLPLKGWPLTLPNDLHHMQGIQCLSDYPRLHSNLFTCVLIADLVSAYPSEIAGMNMSKQTTRHEFIRLNGAHCSPAEVLLQNMNLFNGATNALDYCVKVYGFPSLKEVDKLLASASA